MLKYSLKTFIVVIISLILSCGKKNTIDTNTQFLGHKGAGSNNYNDEHMENTISAVQYALQKFDGVELDIQMSLDETIWVFHNNSLAGSTCDINIQDTIPKMRDADIEKIMLCHQNKTSKINKLSEIINWLNTRPNGAPVSLDVKFSFSKTTFGLYGGKDNYFIKLAASLSKVFTNYKFTHQVLVEVDSQLFCNSLKVYDSTKNIITCFMRYEPMAQKIKNAVRLGYDGLSCNYTDPTVTQETIQEAHNAGLIVQLFTPYYRDELRFAFNMNPDYIQSDNIYAKQALNVN